MPRMTLEERKKNFVNKARSVHGDKYDYTQAEQEFKNNQTAVTIICPIHGEFKQKPGNHIFNQTSCPSCARISAYHKKVDSIDRFIEKARETHGDRYDYSTVIYARSREKVDITCKTHGVFSQTPVCHIQGAGCPQCATQSSYDLAYSTFISRSNEIHDGKYDYSDVKYKNAHTHVDIRCPEHGLFSQVPLAHVKGFGCTKCTEWGYSSLELEILEFVESLGVTAIHNSRSIIPPKEIDIYIPDMNVGIEFNGLYWHSTDNPKSKKPIKYHQDKALGALEKGVLLINIWEDDWVDLSKREVIKKKLKTKLGVCDERVYARNTYPVKLSHSEAKSIVEPNHVQGFHPSSSYVGLKKKSDDQVVAVMGMRKNEEGIYELTRYATSCSVVGGFSKILSYWKKNTEWDEIFTFAHLDYSHGGMYEKTGFTKEHITPPGMWYCKGGTKYRRELFMKHKLHSVLDDFNPDLSEKDNMFNNGYYRVYDCGSIRYSMKNE